MCRVLFSERAVKSDFHTGQRVDDVLALFQRRERVARLVVHRERPRARRRVARHLDGVEAPRVQRRAPHGRAAAERRARERPLALGRLAAALDAGAAEAVAAALARRRVRHERALREVRRPRRRVDAAHLAAVVVRRVVRVHPCKCCAIACVDGCLFVRLLPPPLPQHVGALVCAARSRANLITREPPSCTSKQTANKHGALSRGCSDRAHHIYCLRLVLALPSSRFFLCASLYQLALPLTIAHWPSLSYRTLPTALTLAIVAAAISSSTIPQRKTMSAAGQRRRISGRHHAAARHRARLEVRQDLLRRERQRPGLDVLR